ncbi:MAG: extracellular solute-binding protein [Candidatus Eisenbacteria bacterium]|nr:extracellular solute-binding protein [Candidatus Eisenbacteria bacterium]
MIGKIMRTMSWLLLLPAVTGVFGCSGGSTPAGPITVHFWQFWEADVVGPILTRFEAENPGIKVQMKQLTWQNGREEILAAVAANTAPDLCELGSTWFGRFAADGALADISAETDSLRARLRQWEAAMHNGRVYGVPWVLGTRAVFYNKRLFREAGLNPDLSPPDTWPRLMEAASKIHKPDAGTYGFGRNSGERYVLFKKFMPLAWSNGGDVLSADGLQSVFNSTENLEALKFWLSLKSVSLTERQDQIDQAFKQERIGIIQSGAWLFKTLPTDAPKLEYGVCRMPRPDGNNRVNRSFGGGEILVIFKNSPRREAALKLAAFLARGDNALALCRVAKSVQPAAVGMENDDYYQANPGERTFVEQLTTAVFPPNDPSWQEMENAVENWVEKAMFEKVTAEKALEEADQEIVALLHARIP